MAKPNQAPAGPSLGAGSAYTFQQGSALVTVVTDGYISIPEAVLTAGAEPCARGAIIDRLTVGAHGVPAAANIPVVRTGNDVIVFDVGGGGVSVHPVLLRLRYNFIALFTGWERQQCDPSNMGHVCSRR